MIIYILLIKYRISILILVDIDPYLTIKDNLTINGCSFFGKSQHPKVIKSRSFKIL
jgi:hypothetical protein